MNKPTTEDKPYQHYFTFYSQDKTKSKNIYWGRQSPFNLVMLAMAKELGENCTYKYQERTEYQAQKFD